MFDPADQNKLAAVLTETFDAFTLAGQFNAVAKALDSKNPRSDHSEALLKIYRTVLNTVAERQYRQAYVNAAAGAHADIVEGVLTVIAPTQTFGRGGAPAPRTVLKTVRGDITVHIAGAKPFDINSRPDKVFAALTDKKVFAKGYLWANEDGVHLTLGAADKLTRWSPAAQKLSSLRKPK